MKPQIDTTPWHKRAQGPFTLAGPAARPDPRQLPLRGDLSHHEAGVPVQKGNDPGAPVQHNLGKKMRLNSLVAFVLWLVAMAFMYLIHVPLPEIH